MDRLLKKLEVPHDGGTVPNRWYSNDIKPIEKGRRTWGFWHFHNYWILINANISTYMTGSSLIALGLNWWQAIIAIVVGNLLATVFVILNSLPGAYYNLGFPVVNRYVWGLYGSQFVILNRILLSIVWYGFQSWIGGECLYVCLLALSPSLESHIPNTLSSSTGTTTAHFLAYILFMLLSLPVLYIRPHNLTRLFHASATIILVFFLVLLIWALATMGPAGFGDTFASSPPTGTETSLAWLVCYGVISTIGSIAAGILNQNDYARFARQPRDAVLGQLWSFPLYAILCSVAGILVTAATQARFGGAALWSLPELLGAVVAHGGGRSRAAAFFGGAALVVSQIGVNVPGNALSGGFDFAATLPTYLDIRRGAYLTAALSVATNPWLLVNTATTFLAVLSAYAVFLGPMTGCMIASYLLVNRKKLKVEDLYSPSYPARSIYWYTCGVNWRAAVAWAAGTAPSLPGFVASLDASVAVPVGFTHLYYLCFLSGFCIAAAVYTALHMVFPARAVAEWVRAAPPAGALMRAYRERWDREEAEVVDGVGVGGEGEEGVDGQGDDGGEDGKGGRVAVKRVDGV